MSRYAFVAAMLSAAITLPATAQDFDPTFKTGEKIKLRAWGVPGGFGVSPSDYAKRQIMTAFVAGARERDVECMAFGDLYLEDVRTYREKNLAGTGISPLFPLWGLPTDQLARTMITSGLQAYITCLDPKVLPPEFAGRRYDESFLRDLPDDVDPCGENGEFHSCVVDGPMFSAPLEVRPGEVVHRDGFVFADLL